MSLASLTGCTIRKASDLSAGYEKAPSLRFLARRLTCPPHCSSTQTSCRVHISTYGWEMARHGKTYQRILSRTLHSSPRPIPSRV